MAEISEKLSPIRQVYKTIRFSGLILDTNKPWSLVLSIYHMVMLNYVGPAAVLDVILRERNLTDFVQAISTLMVYMHNNAKAVNIYAHQKEVKQLLDRMDKFSMEISQDETKNYLEVETHSQSFRTKFLSIYSISMIWLPPFSFVTGVIGDYMSGFVKPHIPLQVWLPWSMNEFWPYLAGMIFVTLLELSACIYYMSATIILFTFTNELSACLRILQARLEANGPADKKVYEYHKEIIQLLQDFNKLFCGPLYIEILVTTLQPCGFGYAFIKLMKRYDPAAFEVVIKSLLSVIAPGIVCACGQEISAQMEQLHTRAYMSRWYEEKPKVRRDLVTMLTITTKRLDLNYRNFISYNYVCYASVLQGIYTYLMMIINFDTD